MFVCTLHLFFSPSQLNKVIDENSSLRNSIARSPPATSTSPPAIDEEVVPQDGEGAGRQGETTIPIYAEVDKSKVSQFLTGHH